MAVNVNLDGSRCKKQTFGELGKEYLGKKVAEIQLLTNHFCQHGLLALDL
jgi:hypothetical protein